jgi:hypothetical protein
VKDLEERFKELEDNYWGDGTESGTQLGNSKAKLESSESECDESKDEVASINNEIIPQPLQN